MQNPNHPKGESIPPPSKTSHSFFESPLSYENKLSDSSGAFYGYMIRDRPLPIDRLRRENE